MSKLIKPLHIRSTIGFYGAEKVISLLLPCLKDMGVDAELVCIEGSIKDSKRLSTVMLKHKLIVYSLVAVKKLDVNIIRQLQNIIIKNEYTIIHTHDYKSLFYVFNSARKMDIPVVHHMHGALGNTFSEYIYGIIEKIICHFITSIVVVSRKQQHEVSKGMLPMPPVNFLQNSVFIPDISDHLGIGEKINISMVARLTSEKNHILAINSISEVIKSNNNINLNIYGDGPLLPVIEECVKNNNLEDYVTFHGYVGDINYIYKNTDLLLITSRTEGLPMTLLEAMSYAIPVVSTNVGEISNILKSAKCGAIVNQEVSSISKAIVKFINTPGELKNLGANARSYAERYLTIDKQAENLLKIYGYK